MGMIKRFVINLVLGYAKPFATVETLNKILAQGLTELLHQLPTDTAVIAKWGDVISRLCRVLTSLGVAVQDGVITEKEVEGLVKQIAEAVNASDLTDGALQNGLERLGEKLKELA